MNKYSSTMDKIKVTPQMEERILRNLFNNNENSEQIVEKKRAFDFKWFRPVSAVVFAVIILFFSSNWEKGQNVSSQLVNAPIVNIEGAEALKDTLTFELFVPGKLPTGYIIEETSVVRNLLAQIVYSDGINNITFRAAEGTEDISGDYTVYKSTEVVSIGDTEATLKGNNELIHLAIWTKDDYSYALYFSAGLDKETVISIIESMKKA